MLTPFVVVVVVCSCSLCTKCDVLNDDSLYATESSYTYIEWCLVSIYMYVCTYDKLLHGEDSMEMSGCMYVCVCMCVCMCVYHV